MLRSGGVWYGGHGAFRLGIVGFGWSRLGGQGVLCSGMASYGEIWSGEAVELSYGQVRWVMARRLGLGKFWRGELRLGELRLGGSGGAGYVSERRGPAWRSRPVTLRNGWVRLGWVWRSWCVPMWRGPVWRGGRGSFRFGRVGCVQAVVFG